MINYQDSLFLQINSPLDAKMCNYYRDGSYFKIEPISKYLERTIDIYRAPGVIVTVLLPKDGYTPIYDGDGLIAFPLLSFEEELDNFDIKYYTFKDGLQDIDFVEIDFGYTYVAYASDDMGADFSLTPIEGLDYIGVLVSSVKKESLVVSDFDGLWHRPSIIQVDWDQTDTNAPDYIKNKPSIVQSDWDETVNTDPAYIKNKPIIPILVQSDWNQINNLADDYIKNKPSVIQSDWNQTNNTAIDYIKNKPNLDSISPDDPLSSIQYNNNGLFGGSAGLLYKPSLDRIFLSNTGSGSSGIYFASTPIGPQMWVTGSGTIWRLSNTNAGNILYINTEQIGLGETTMSADTFLQVTDKNVTPKTYTVRIKDNAGNPIASIKEDGSIYLEQLTESQGTKILYIDEVTGLLTFGDITRIQSDWNEVDTNSPAYIQNKPTIPEQIQVDWEQTDNQQVDYIKNKPDILQSDWEQHNDTFIDYIKNKPTIIQSDWAQSDNLAIDYIKNKPNIDSVSPGAPLNSVQYNNSGAFGGSSGFIYKKNQDRLYLLDSGSGSSGIHFTDSYYGPQLWVTSGGTAWRLSNTVPGNAFYINTEKVGISGIGGTTNDADTFFQINDRNISPFNFTVKVKDSTGSDLLSLDKNGQLYVHKLTENIATKTLYIDPTSKVVTFGDISRVTLTAGTDSGIDVNDGNSSSEETIEISQNDSKLPTVTANTSDYIGFYDTSESIQAKTTLGNLPGWNILVNGLSAKEVKLGDYLDITGSNGITIDYSNNTIDISAEGLTLDLYVDDELVEPTISKLNIVPGTNVLTTYLGNGGIRIDAVPSITDGIKTGGSVIWLHDYTYSVSYTEYVLSGELFIIPSTEISLPPSDPTYSRIDIIAVDINGDVIVVEGIPSSDPQKPSLNPSSQLELTYVLLLANTSQPNYISDYKIYDENVEWTGTKVGGATVNFASINDAYSGILSTEVSNISDGDLITYTNWEVLSADDYDSISLFIKLKGIMIRWIDMYITLYNGLAKVSNTIKLPIDKDNTTNWQSIIIPMQSFTLLSNDFNKVIFSWVEAKTMAESYVGFFLDLAKLQAGVSQEVIPSTNIKLVGDVTANGDTSNPIQTTLTTVNSDVGTFGDATHVPSITIDAKGRITAASENAISVPSTYADISANDPGTDVTALELEELTDGSTTSLHTHDYGDIANTPDPTWELDSYGINYQAGSVGIGSSSDNNIALNIMTSTLHDGIMVLNMSSDTSSVGITGVGITGIYGSGYNADNGKGGFFECSGTDGRGIVGQATGTGGIGVTGNGTLNDYIAINSGIYSIKERTTTPANPDSGFGYIYVKSDGKAYYLNDGGIEYDLTGSTVGAHTHTLSDITDSGSMAGLDYWTGTQAEYDALGSYDNNTIYFIEE